MSIARRCQGDGVDDNFFVKVINRLIRKQRKIAPLHKYSGIIYTNINYFKACFCIFKDCVQDGELTHGL